MRSISINQDNLGIAVMVIGAVFGFIFPEAAKWILGAIALLALMGSVMWVVVMK